MNKYFLKPSVTNEMLCKLGFFQGNRRHKFTSRSDTYLSIQGNEVVLNKCVFYGIGEAEIKRLPMVKKYINDLIELNYVEKRK